MIIADPQLPDMEDWELIQQLTSSGLYGDIPIVILSALDAASTEQKCREYGVAKYYLKPFNPVDLIEDISTIMVNGRVKGEDVSVMAG